MTNINYSKSLLLKVYFQPTNILFTLTFLEGSIVFWTSVGMWKIRGTKKLTLAAIEIALKAIFKKVAQLNCKFLHIELCGFNKNKKTITKLLKSGSTKIRSISDKTSNPHNGCRKKKSRRI
uniref:Ribosomal protein S11 n=1 Tax=Gelidiella fanii TaxID=485435 RepID=A0A7G9IVR9_9FLOR|nr:ribosomal protein S11 [Gelidiella fanii]QNM39463.1 ribosomal protein S11 [Gelidiella fanii]